MGQIVTFYSYKGGVGRTMALANIAVLLAQWNYKVLLVDWDLEAPGLEFYFKDFLNLAELIQQEGLIELLGSANADTQSFDLNWEDLLTEINVTEGREPIHFITAGKREKSSHYFEKISQLNWDDFYQKEGGFLIEQLRNQWKEKYDYILIDSRTGITDIGGICTIQLPDVLVLLFTATEQSFGGAVEVAHKAKKARWNLPFDRLGLICLPIPSRFDSSEEFKIAQEWLDRFAEGLSEIYADWLPTSVNKKQFLEVTKIPYIRYFSFGEKLPVLEQGTTDPAGLGYAYENLAAIIADNFESVEELIQNRDRLISEQLTPKSKFQIFLAYAYEDEDRVYDLYKKLNSAGYKVWFDKKNLLPGSEWRHEIPREIQNSDIVLFFVSHQSVKATSGYRENRYLISLRSFCQIEKKKILIIPIKLDNVNLPYFSVVEPIPPDDPPKISLMNISLIELARREISLPTKKQMKEYEIQLRDYKTQREEYEVQRTWNRVHDFQGLDYWERDSFERLIEAIEYYRLTKASSKSSEVSKDTSD